MQSLSRSILQSLFLAIILVIIRNLLVYWQSPYGSPGYLWGSLISIPEAALWFLIPVLLLNQRQKPIRIAGLLILIVISILHLLSIHYELVFGRLPGVSILYYLTEIGHLAPSLGNNVPLWLFLAEAGLIVALWHLYPAKLKLSSIPTLVLAVLILSSATLARAYPEKIADSAYWSSKNPLGWMMQSAALQLQFNRASPVTRNQVWEFQSLIGQNPPRGGYSASYPLCAPRFAGGKVANRRSVILVVLEGVGHNEMVMQVDSRAVMPNLQRFSRENLYFANHYATGTKSNHAMVSVYTGLPAQPVQNLLWSTPLPHTQSFVRRLARNGYRSGYFHGGDLSFEQQRTFLKNLGIEEIREYDPNSSHPLYGWGYDDGFVFDQMKDWIEEQRGVPYIASLFSLSTHDPYLLPESWQPVFIGEALPGNSEDRRVGAMIDSYHFLDYHLGRFVDWFNEHEKPKGTILVVFGDHTPHYWNEAHDDAVREMTFRVPLILSGQDLPLDRQQELASRLSTLSDIPATLARLLQMPQEACDQGIDLLQQEWPQNRWVYSVGGDSQERIYVWNRHGQLVLDRITGQLQILDHEVPYETLPESNTQRLQESKQFIQTMLSIQKYLAENNAYAPAPKFERPVVALPRVTQPIVVSHRGNTTGENGDTAENSRAALQQAIDSGFEWVEIDFQITEDGVPVAMHDDFILLNDEKVPVANLRLDELRRQPGFAETMTIDQVFEEFGERINFLIEAKPPVGKHVGYHFALADYITRLVRGLDSDKRVIVDSFSNMIAGSINEHCGCDVGQDAPFKQPVDSAYLQDLVTQEIEWVYAHHSVIDAETIRLAHRYGIKVMAYTVNDIDVIERWGGEMPDGIITDSNAIRLALMQPGS